MLSTAMLSNSFPAALKKAGYHSAYFGKLHVTGMPVRLLPVVTP